MTAQQNCARLARYWRGYLAGTNRGGVTIKLKQSGIALRAKAIFLDQQFGPTFLDFSGKLEGARAELKLNEFDGSAPLRPLDGTIVLNFDQNLRTAEGTWQTDIGTSGGCKLESCSCGMLRWGMKRAVARLRLFLLSWIAALYVLFLIIIALASLTQRVQVSGLTLVLLLLPAPFLLTADLAKLISVFRQARIKKIGPVEFDQNPPTTDIVAMMTQHAQEAVIFFALNNYFVLRTKVLAIILMQKSSLDHSEFTSIAIALGVQAENVKETCDALVIGRCAQVVSDRITITRRTGTCS